MQFSANRNLKDQQVYSSGELYTPCNMGGGGGGGGGVEVVWNEVQFSANRNIKDQQVYSDEELYTS